MSQFSSFLDFVLASQQRDGGEPFELSGPQRVWCQVVVDNVCPSTLPDSDRAICRTIFGIDGPIPPEARDVSAKEKGARIGGTLLNGLAVGWLGMTVKAKLAKGEQLFCILAGPDMRLGRQPLNYIKGAFAAVGWAPVASASDSITMRRADGIEVVYRVLPAARAGTATRGRTLGAALMTEAAFFRDPETGVVNDSEVYRSMLPRVVRGGKLFLESTVWADSGLLRDLVKHNFGDPKTAIATRAPTLVFRPDDAKLRATVEAERARDKPNADREFDLVPLAAGSSMLAFPGEHVDIATTHWRPPRPQPHTWGVGAPVTWPATMFIDMSRGGGDSLAIAAVGMARERYDPPYETVRTVVQDNRKVEEYSDDMGGSWHPLPPVGHPDRRMPPPARLVVYYVEGIHGRWQGKVTTNDIVDRLLTVARTFGCKRWVGDGYETLLPQNAAENNGYDYHNLEWSNGRKSEATALLRNRLADQTIAIPNRPLLVQQLKEWSGKILPSGLVHWKGSGPHDDMAAVVALAVAGEVAGHVEASPYRRAPGAEKHVVTDRHFGYLGPTD